MEVNFRVYMTLDKSGNVKVKRVGRYCALPWECKGCPFEKMCDKLMDVLEAVGNVEAIEEVGKKDEKKEDRKEEKTGKLVDIKFKGRIVRAFGAVSVSKPIGSSVLGLSLVRLADGRSLIIEKPLKEFKGVESNAIGVYEIDPTSIAPVIEVVYRVNKSLEEGKGGEKGDNNNEMDRGAVV